MRTVNKKTMTIVGVLAVVVVLFCAAFQIASENQANAEYAREQDDALTHDVTPIAQLGPISLATITAFASFSARCLCIVWTGNTRSTRSMSL